MTKKQQEVLDRMELNKEYCTYELGFSASAIDKMVKAGYLKQKEIGNKFPKIIKFIKIWKQ